MPVYAPAKSLVDLSVNALCDIVFHILDQVVSITEKTDAEVQLLEDQIEETFLKKKMTKKGKQKKNTKSAAFNVKQMVKRYSDFTLPFLSYMEYLPTAFTHRIYSQVLNDFFRIAGKFDEDDIEANIVEKWGFPPRIRVAFRVLLTFYFVEKVHTFNMNALTDKYFRLIAAYIFKKELYKDDAYMAEMAAMNHNVFIGTIISFKNQFSSLVSISMRHLASGLLLWTICTHCQHLWYLDISGEMFDLQRYCVIKNADGKFVSAISLESQKLFDEADFVDSLCGLYGNNGYPHPKFGTTAIGCFKLRRLLLPSYTWEAKEEMTFLEQMLIIFCKLVFLEEVTGVCLFHILCKLCLPEMESPLMLKLKKFDGTDGGHRLIAVESKRLMRVKMPCVEEVVFISNIVMTPSLLYEVFPNLKHLSIIPYDARAYNFESILPHLSNLVSLDIEYLDAVTLSDMYVLAKQCRLLKSLSINCPALFEDRHAESVQVIEEEKKKRIPFYLRPDKQEKRIYPCVPYEDINYIVYFYRTKLYNLCYSDSPSFDCDDSTIPDFSKLVKLQFFGLKQMDEVALYQVVRGSPFLQTFTLVVPDVPDCKVKLTDTLFGHLAPHLKRVKEVLIAGDNIKSEDFYLTVSSYSVAHFLYFCKDIRSIGRLGDWNSCEAEIEGLNHFFKKQNLILRVH